MAPRRKWTKTDGWVVPVPVPKRGQPTPWACRICGTTGIPAASACTGCAKVKAGDKPAGGKGKGKSKGKGKGKDGKTKGKGTGSGKGKGGGKDALAPLQLGADASTLKQVSDLLSADTTGALDDINNQVKKAMAEANTKAKAKGKAKEEEEPKA